MNKPMMKPVLHPKTAPRDSIDDIMAGWEVCRPDLDAHHLATVGRIVRLSLLMRDRIEKGLAQHGLAWDMFDLLLTIYRWEGVGTSGVRPTDLYAECLLSSGGMTARLRRAEEEGYIVRRRDPADGRGARISLTAKGRNLVKKLVPGHFAASHDLVSILGKGDRDKLADLLQLLLISLEGSPEETLQNTAQTAS